MLAVKEPIPTKPVPRFLKGHRIGYVRVSTIERNGARQLECVEVGRTFTDKASGKDVKRPQLETLLAFVREGDTVVCQTPTCSSSWSCRQSTRKATCTGRFC